MMRRRRTAYALLLLPIAPPVGAECGRYVREVQQVERSWLRAYETRDGRAMSAILDEAFTITHVDASLQRKADVIRSLGEPGDQIKVTYRTEDVQGRCYGRTVILTVWVVESDGDRSRYTDTMFGSGGAGKSWPRTSLGGGAAEASKPRLLCRSRG